MELPEGLAEAINEIIRSERRDSKIHKAAVRMQEALKNDNQVWRLRRAFYGLKQSGERWYNCLRDILGKIGLKPTASDPCVFTGEIQGFIIFITVWVDDILVQANNEELLKHVKKNLSKELEIKNFDDAQYCEGIEIDQNTRIKLCWKKYVAETIKRLNMEECNAAKTPASPGEKLDEKTGVRTNKSKKWYPHKELVGSLMYLVTCAQPDIAHTVSRLAQFNDSPQDHHWGAVRRYLTGTAELSLLYHMPMRNLTAYSDFSYAERVSGHTQESPRGTPQRKALVIRWNGSRCFHQISGASKTLEIPRGLEPVMNTTSRYWEGIL